ncbi:MAG: RNase adapter RapZ [Micrococcaceae bacterium]
MNQEVELLVVTGMSGAGRSTAGNALEDQGWYVVDNLPPQMLPVLYDMVIEFPQNNKKLAILVDARGKHYSADTEKVLKDLRANGLEFKILFLDASDQVLIKRYELARRPHPLQADGTILDGISEERNFLASMRSLADTVLDTSNLNVHEFSQEVVKIYTGNTASKLRVTVMSFGFKHGIPMDAHYVADVRFIPNPHWVPELRPKTGLDKEVSSYVLKQDGVDEFTDNYVAALRPVCEGYLVENKNYATFAIGCTGGKHRSVAMTLEIAKRISTFPNVEVTVAHRDIGRN